MTPTHPGDREALAHDLKCWPEYYEAIADGRKTFEVRNDDRGYRVGDTLRLREFKMPSIYTGRETAVTVTYILRSGGSIGGVESGYAVMGFRLTPSITSDDERRAVELANEVIGRRETVPVGWIYPHEGQTLARAVLSLHAELERVRGSKQPKLPPLAFVKNARMSPAGPGEEGD